MSTVQWPADRQAGNFCSKSQRRGFYLKAHLKRLYQELQKKNQKKIQSTEEAHQKHRDMPPYMNRDYIVNEKINKITF